MKRCFAPALTIFFSAFVSAPVTAQTDHSGHGAMPATAAAASLADGLVKKIDKVNQRVTLAHGPLPNGMPGMTMAFRVKDPAWLDKMKEGQKIRFATEEIKGELTVVRFEPAP